MRWVMLLLGRRMGVWSTNSKWALYGLVMATGRDGECGSWIAAEVRFGIPRRTWRWAVLCADSYQDAIWIDEGADDHR